MLLSIGICYVQLIVFTHLISILMGAPLFTDVIRTLIFSIYLVLIGFTPIIICSKGNLKNIYDFVFQITTSNSNKRFYMKSLVWGTIIGAWLGAIPIPLDWDRWWQQWPITCFVSSTMGAVLSLPISYLYLWIRQSQKSNADIE